MADQPLFARGDRVKFSKQWFEVGDNPDWREREWRGTVISAPENVDWVRVKWDHERGSHTCASEFIEEAEEQDRAVST